MKNNSPQELKQMFELELTLEEKAYTAGWLAACRTQKCNCKTEESYGDYIENMANYFNKNV